MLCYEGLQVTESLRAKTLEFDQLRREMDEVIAQLALAPARGSTPCPQADEVKELQDELQKATQVNYRRLSAVELR